MKSGLHKDVKNNFVLTKQIVIYIEFQFHNHNDLEDVINLFFMFELFKNTNF